MRISNYSDIPVDQMVALMFQNRASQPRSLVLKTSGCSAEDSSYSGYPNSCGQPSTKQMIKGDCFWQSDRTCGNIHNIRL